MSEVVVIDYEIGNVFSVCNALKRIGATPLLTRDPVAIRNARRLILPGVGAFSRAMENLRRYHMDAHISDYVATGRPFLGVCIGMQVLMDRSTEFGDHAGLGLIAGSVERIPATTPLGAPLRVPHIAWSEVRSCESATPRWDWAAATFAGPEHYYFVHSYAARPVDPGNLLAITQYGGHDIAAAVRRDNITGVQFHPERSGPAGLHLLQLFVETDPG